MTGRSPLARVVITIAAYRSDESVLALLGRIFSQGGDEAAAVIIVDSENDGSLGRRLAELGWPVEYENSPVNLGSAGNLTRRLELSARKDADWCFALNHDGMFDRTTVEALVRCGAGGDRVGAVYPKRVLTSRGGTVLQPHRSLFGLPRFAGAAAPADRVMQVAWDSSNGALYALAPVRQGLSVSADLWMGWEDLAYGWLLSAKGWSQLYCPAAEFLDDYEYESVTLLGRPYFITRKPAWYGYYQVRNLILIMQRMGWGWGGVRFLAVRLLRELAFAILFRREKAARLRLLWLGLVDGFRGVTGRGRGR